jgi:hypothetical protein
MVEMTSRIRRSSFASFAARGLLIDVFGLSESSSRDKRGRPGARDNGGATMTK